MINTILLVAAGGAIGALLREFLMLAVGTGPDGFPVDILVANVTASFLLGLAFALHARAVLNDSVYVLLGTGVMGGLSTFSSFVLAVVQLADASRAGATTALLYLVASLVLGFAAVMLGLRLGRGGRGDPGAGPSTHKE